MSELLYFRPANFITSPGFEWDAMLLMTKIELELIHVVDVLHMIEKMKRGGFCCVGSKRDVKANNNYVGDYNPNAGSNYLMSWDGNNCCSWAMSRSLQCKMCRWEERTLLKKILRTPEYGRKGYAVAVGLEFLQQFA